MSTSATARLGRWLGFASADKFYECRRCGTTLDGPTSNCPVCGSDSIAEYDL
ncbi:MAG: hypothetical protein ACOC42_03085 [Halobacteriota archaeon]